jgi:D-arabinose 1-dehydrogenase-like Zn-dependent alcohol dehydrogenase
LTSWVSRELDPCFTILHSLTHGSHSLGSTMGSAKEFSDCVRFVEKHKIKPVIDTILNGLDNAHHGCK